MDYLGQDWISIYNQLKRDCHFLLVVYTDLSGKDAQRQVGVDRVMQQGV